MSEPELSGLGPAGPTPAPPAAVPVGPAPKVYKSTPEERQRWRLKAQMARAKRLAAAGQPGAADEVARLQRDLGSVPVGAPRLATDPVATAPGTVVPGVAVVPWDPGLLSPLFAAVVPEVEKLDVASLRAKAAAIDDQLAARVEKDAGWNPVAKATLTTTGPQVVAQALNSAGISAEHAPAIALMTAVASIFAGRTILARKLDEMAARSRSGASAQPPPVEPSTAE